MSKTNSWAAQMLEAWQRDSALRAEFGNDPARYIALAEDDEAKRRGLSRQAFRQREYAAPDIDAEYERAMAARANYGGAPVSRDFIAALATAWRGSEALRREFMNNFGGFRAHFQSIAAKARPR